MRWAIRCDTRVVTPAGSDFSDVPPSLSYSFLVPHRSLLVISGYMNPLGVPYPFNGITGSLAILWRWNTPKVRSVLSFSRLANTEGRTN